MKELSTQEKAKAYDEAYKKVADRFGSDVADEIFTECKESYGEKIRKAMISGMAALKEQGKETFATIPLNDCIDWLEKEGKQNSVNTDLDELVIQLEEAIGTSPHSRETIKDFFQKAVQKYMNCLKIATGEIGALVEENYRLKEKQGDEAEPRFKVGDKIKLAREPKYPEREIIAIKNGAYYFDKLVHLPFSRQDEWELVEQKPADEAEPKFKVGDTITYIGERKELVADKYTIKEISKNCYISTCGNKIPFSMEEYYTIVNDAKFKVGDKIRKKSPRSFDTDMEVARIDKGYYICNHIGKFSSEVVPFSEESYYELIEQKPANEVEPKFHEGDWIVFNGWSLFIKEVVPGYYRTVSRTGIPNSYDWDIDNVARLWTIDDAKPGDVLVDKGNNIGIFQECEGIYWNSYIYLGCDGELRGFSIGGAHEQNGTHPATKEQCDTLMKAMADAGYTFDFDKKKFKKIEPKFKTGDWV